jgi:thioredoxin-like negative regulator of GroEL
MAPVVHGLESEYEDRIRFTYLDVDSAAVTPFRQELGVRGIPQFYLLDGDGTVIQQWTGLLPETVLADAIESELARR